MKYINRSNPVTKLSPHSDPAGMKSCYIVYYRVAGMLGVNGPYVVTANSISAETELQNSPNFKQWLTEGKSQTFWV